MSKQMIFKDHKYKLLIINFFIINYYQIVNINVMLLYRIYKSLKNFTVILSHL